MYACMYACTYQTYFRSSDTYRLKVKEWKEDLTKSEQGDHIYIRQRTLSQKLL